jgi:hypothetical protein
LEKDIGIAIVSENEMSDNASDKLKSIRRKIASTNVKLKEKLASYTRNNSVSNYLQDNLVTIRNNRFVFSILYEDITVFGDGSREKFEEKLVMEIKKYLDSYTTNQNGLYLIKFYNYLNTKSLNLYDFDIEILHKG